MIQIIKKILEVQMFLLTEYDDVLKSLQELHEKVLNGQYNYAKASKRIKYALAIYNIYINL